jgi:predicted glycosyltransferase
VTADIVIYVQNLLGVGHLARVASIAETVADLGGSVAILCGGVRPAGYAPRGVQYIQLEPCQADDASCKSIRDTRGNLIDDAFLERRSAQLKDILLRLQPKVFVTEMFPFGRWRFRQELLPVLDWLRGWEAPPRLAISVRDVINQGSVTGERSQQVAALIRAKYDHVLVHGDPFFLPLEATWPPATELADKLIYTGYVMPSRQFSQQQVPALPVDRDFVLVSAGGGLYGASLYRAALTARPLSQRFNQHHWIIVAGPYCPAHVLAELQTAAPAGVTILPQHPHLGTLFPLAAASISQAGCNTVLELLNTRTPAVVVPFDEGKESEQTDRARLLAEKGVFTLLPAANLTPATLADALDNTRPPTDLPDEIHTHGAEVSAMHLMAWGKAPN